MSARQRCPPPVALAALALGALGACAGAGKERRGETVAPGTRVASVQLRGNQAASSRTILRLLAHQRPSGTFQVTWTRYDPVTLALDRRRIAAFYRERGYFSAEVTEVEVYRARRGAGIRFHVDEGEPTTIESIVVQGLPDEAPFVPAEILAGFGLVEGARFSHGSYLEARDALRRRLTVAGWAHPQVRGEVRVDRDRHLAEVRLAVEAGHRTRLAEPVIEADEPIPLSTIRARLAWEPGDHYSPEKIDRTAAHLRELGVGTVRVEVPRDDEVDLVSPLIRITRGRPRELKVGAGAAMDSARGEARGRADFAWHGIGHPLLTFRSRFRPGVVVHPDRQLIFELGASVVRQDFLAPLVSATASAGIELKDYDAFTTLHRLPIPGAGLHIARPLLDRRLQLSAGWQFHVLDISPRDDVIAAALPASSPHRIGFFEQTVTLDLRDDAVRTRRGGFAALRLEEGTSFAGGAIPYYRGTLDLRGYVPLGPRLTLAGQARGGLLETFGAGDEPVTRRFYSGGSAAHRGFSARRLAPSVIDGSGSTRPLGGDVLVEASAEVRADLTRIWTAVAFLDAGDVTTDTGDIDLASLHYAAGLGIRLQTPVGALRVDLAFRLNRLGAALPDGRPNPSPGDSWALHFAIGEAF